MADKNREIKIQLSADGEKAIISALKSVERAAKNAGDAASKAGAGGAKSLLTMRGAASGLNSVLNTTANLSTSVFTGIAAGGMLIGGAFSTAQSAVGSLKSAIDTLRSTAIEAAHDIKDLKGLAASMQFEGPDAASDAGAYLSALASVSYDAEAGDIADFLNDIATKVREARDGEEAALKIMSDLNLRMEDVIDTTTGQLKKPAEILDEIMKSAAVVDRSLRNNALERIVGTGGVRNFAPIFDTSPAEIQRMTKEFKELNGVSSSAVAAADKVTESQKRLAASFKGVGAALLEGMGPSIAEGNAELTEFLVENRDKVREFGAVVGDFSGELYGKLMNFAEKASSDLSGVGGDLASGPLKTGLDAILEAIDWILERLGELTAYLGQGQSVPWIDDTVAALKKAGDGAKAVYEGLKNFASFVRDDVAPAVKSLTEIIGGLFEAVGIEDTGAQLGITLALAAFGSTIVSVIASVGSLISKVTKLGVALAAASGVAAAPVAVGAIAFAGSAKLGYDERSAVKSMDDAYSQMPAIAEKYGNDAASALMLGAFGEVDKQFGKSWLDSLRGAFGGANAKDRRLEFTAELSDASKDDVIDQMADMVRDKVLNISDDTIIDAGAFQISGFEINARVQQELAAIPAALEITGITGISDHLESVSAPASLASAEAAAATAGGAQTVNLQINGAPAGTFSGSSDSLAALQRAVARNNRGM